MRYKIKLDNIGNNYSNNVKKYSMIASKRSTLFFLIRKNGNRRTKNLRS